MASAEVLQQMQSRAQQSDDLISKLRSKLLAVRTAQGMFSVMYVGSLKQ